MEFKEFKIKNVIAAMNAFLNFHKGWYQIHLMLSLMNRFYPNKFGVLTLRKRIIATTEMQIPLIGSPGWCSYCLQLSKTIAVIEIQCNSSERNVQFAQMVEWLLFIMTLTRAACEVGFHKWLFMIMVLLIRFSAAYLYFHNI